MNCAKLRHDGIRTTNTPKLKTESSRILLAVIRKLCTSDSSDPEIQSMVLT